MMMSRYNLNDNIIELQAKIKSMMSRVRILLKLRYRQQTWCLGLGRYIKYVESYRT